MTTAQESQSWTRNRIIPEEIDKYLIGGDDFIPHQDIERDLLLTRDPDKSRVEDIVQKALAIKTLTPEETAVLVNVTDPDVIARMEEAALKVKLAVYDNRIVTFAPLYLNNHCVNDCVYCGLRRSNNVPRRALSMDEIRKEVEVLAGKIGHKRLIMVYGEHPAWDVDYIVETMKTVYGVRTTTPGRGVGEIRRVNINAAPLSIDSLKRLNDAGLGTYQVFQETYHRPTYEKVHPAGTLKGDYRWRLYAMHRAQEAGIDDVGLGVLFGLYDWRFEIMGLIHHAWALEKAFGIGPHTVSFPRVEPAKSTPFTEDLPHRVSDRDFRKIVTVIRLAIPYAGMILTAREPAHVRRQILPLGCTQTDASTRIGVGGYVRDREEGQEQFEIGDPRSLDEVVRELAQMGNITSFCTAGYRCGRTGKCIMELLRSGTEGKFCKMNAVLTFREWLDDFASEETRKAGEPLIRRELDEVRVKLPHAYNRLMESYRRIEAGERDLYF